MLNVRVMPCLLLKEASLVKTVKFKKYNYIGDAINTVKIFNQMEVDELVFLDITATLENRKPNFSLIQDIASECFMPLSYGGGIKDIEDIRKLFRIGVEKVIINSYAFENPTFIKTLSGTFGCQSIIASIDVKRRFGGAYEVYIQGGRKKTGKDPVTYAKYVEKMGAGEILLNSIDRDGTWSGYDIHLAQKVTSQVNVPVISCGGAGKTKDFTEVVRVGGASAVAAGSMFVYQGKDLGVLINFPAREELEKALNRKE